ncbi:MAG: PAS domain-containing protein [Hyphomonadaceae bacterium]|nr:PAS domain-containing protein [Hyphomonadaceae bacterium]
MMGEETFHPDTRALLAYGRALAGAGVAPKKGRADQVLERLMVIERMKDGRLPVRTFGADLIKSFGRDIKEHDFARFFLEPDLRLFAALIESSVAAGGPAIARVLAEAADGKKLGAEILITPLKVERMFGERFLCLFQPLGGESFLAGQPIVRLKLGSLHPPEAKTPKGVRLVVVND